MCIMFILVITFWWSCGGGDGNAAWSRDTGVVVVGYRNWRMDSSVFWGGERNAIDRIVST